MRYRFVAIERASFPVRMLCRLVDAAVSGFYAWRRRGPARHHEDDRRTGETIGAIFAASRRAYGSPRVRAERRAQGVQVSRKRVERLMRAGGLGTKPGVVFHARPTAGMTILWRRTCWGGASLPITPIPPGWPISATSQRARAGCTWPRPRAWPPARSWAGAWPTVSGPSLPAMHCSWPSDAGSRHVGWSTTRTVGCSRRANPARRSWPATACAAR